MVRCPFPRLLEFFHVGPGILREKKPTNSAGTVASISSVGGPQFDFQGSIKTLPSRNDLWHQI
jgi:hypothetical protein